MLRAAVSAFLASRRSTVKRLTGGSLVLAGSLFLITCGSDSPTTPEETGGGARVLTVSLAASSGMPGSRIAISGIPDNVDFAYALITAPAVSPAPGTAYAIAEGDSGVTLIRRTAGGDSLVVPVHPRTPMQGGSVMIEVTDESNLSSNKVQLNIDPVPAAPGAFDALVTQLENLVESWAGQQGTTTGAMRSVSADKLTPLEMPVFFFDAMVSNPENENSLRAFADGDIPLADGEVIDRDLLDGLTALSRIKGFIGAQQAFVDTLTPPDTTASRIAVAAFRGPGPLPCVDPPDFGIGDNECWKLAETMSYQAEIRLEKAGAVEKLQDDAIDAVASALGYAKGAIIAWGILNTIWVSDQIGTASTGIYPSDFLSDATDFVADPMEFDEDFTSRGDWSEFKVTAVSEGWRFDKVILDAVDRAKGLGSSGWDDEKLQDFFEKAQEMTYQDYLDKVQKNVENKVIDQAKTDLGIDDITKLEYCPQTWPGIDCTGLPYSSGTSNSLKYDSDELWYEPVEVGTADLLVETMPIFGPGLSTGETKQIKTNRLEVFIDPFQATMDVEESKDFVARVANAEDQKVEWSIVGATKADTPPVTTKVTTPNIPWQTPIALTAKSMSETGLRKDGKRDSDPRTKTVLITYGGEVGITIDPPYKCIAPGDTLRFKEHVVGLDNYTIIWKIAEGYGTISSSGLYTAPGPPATSNAKISAEIEGVEDVIAFARVDARECNCHFRIGITAPVGWFEEGSDVAYQVSNFGGLIYNFFFDAFGPGGNKALGVSIVDTKDKLAPRPGDPGGLWPVSFAYSSGETGWTSSPEDTIGGVFLDLDEITESFMRGTFFGTAIRYDKDGNLESTATVNIPFRAGHWAGAGWPCN